MPAEFSRGLPETKRKKSRERESQQSETSQNATHVIHLAYENFPCRFIKPTLYLVQCYLDLFSFAPCWQPAPSRLRAPSASSRPAAILHWAVRRAGGTGRRY